MLALCLENGLIDIGITVGKYGLINVTVALR